MYMFGKELSARTRVNVRVLVHIFLRCNYAYFCVGNSSWCNGNQDSLAYLLLMSSEFDPH